MLRHCSIVSESDDPDIPHPISLFGTNCGSGVAGVYEDSILLRPCSRNHDIHRHVRDDLETLTIRMQLSADRRSHVIEIPMPCIHHSSVPVSRGISAVNLRPRASDKQKKQR